MLTRNKRGETKTQIHPAAAMVGEVARGMPLIVHHPIPPRTVRPERNERHNTIQPSTIKNTTSWDMKLVERTESKMVSTGISQMLYQTLQWSSTTGDRRRGRTICQITTATTTTVRINEPNRLHTFRLKSRGSMNSWKKENEWMRNQSSCRAILDNFHK